MGTYNVPKFQLDTTAEPPVFFVPEKSDVSHMRYIVRLLSVGVVFIIPRGSNTIERSRYYLEEGRKVIDMQQSERVKNL